MFPPFSQEKAAKILEKMIFALENGQIELEQVARPSEERKNQGVMLGALVCEDENGQEVNLITNSGIAKKLEMKSEKLEESTFDGTSLALFSRPNFQFSTFSFHFVEPIVSSEEIENALSKNDEEIHRLSEKIKELKKIPLTEENNSELKILNCKLKKLCDESLEKVFALYKFHCIDGKVRPLKEICEKYNHGKLPPTGTGDCCAPKLLDYAFSHNLKPISLAEIQYPLPKNTAHCSLLTAHYVIPPCDERCGILLPAMLGLRILYRDEAICVVNKESGILSVPGRSEEKKDCVESRFKKIFGDAVEILQPAVHRLDMETSGVMILAFTKAAHRELNRQFEAKEIQKEYVALLDGILPKMGIPEHGEMELFFRLDVENRPHQIWDSENGKSAVTEWQILDVERYTSANGKTRNVTRILFKPHTGRTHQLRLASADPHGFGCPIIGDTLYGRCEEGERLMLHATKITFTHPTTGKRMTIESKAEF